MPNYEKSMANDVRHYAELGKTLKALKRLWMLSVFRGDYELADRINPIFNTPGAALNQIVGDAEVLAHMLAKLDDPPLEEIMQEIDGFKPRVDQMNRLPQYNEEFFSVINSIVEPFYARPVAEYNQFDQAVEGLEKLQDLITRVVEEMISQEAKERGFSNPGEFV
jgi:hypothetical protein